LSGKQVELFELDALRLIVLVEDVGCRRNWRIRFGCDVDDGFDELVFLVCVADHLNIPRFGFDDEDVFDLEFSRLSLSTFSPTFLSCWNYSSLE
jgi:hypothetical protein